MAVAKGCRAGFETGGIAFQVSAVREGFPCVLSQSGILLEEPFTKLEAEDTMVSKSSRYVGVFARELMWLLPHSHSVSGLWIL